MSQGIFSALDYLAELIEAITPKTDVHHGFVQAVGPSGLTAPLNAMAGNNRLFQLAIDQLPIDDGQAGLSGRKRAVINLLVRYDLPKDEAFTTRIMTEDTSDLINTLKGPNYDLVNTGIISVITQPPILEPILDQQGEPLALRLTLPFDLLFLEA
jgi:hypothetical protein